MGIFSRIFGRRPQRPERLRPRTADPRWAVRQRLAYEAASQGRLAEGFLPGSSGPYSEVAGGLVLTRDRARDLARNNPHAAHAVDTIVTDLVGTGVKPQSRLTTVVKGKRALDREANAEVEQAFADFARDCVVDGDIDLYGLQRLLATAMVVDGAGLLRRRIRRPEDGLRVPLQLQGLESDHLDTTKDGALANGGRILHGVEFDAIDRRVAYWLYRQHPSERWPLAGIGWETVRVPAEQIIHLYEPKRLGQATGISWMHAIVLALRDHDDVRLALRTRRKIEASLGPMVIANDGDEEGLFPQYDENGNQVEQDRPYYAHSVDGQPVVQAEPGTITILRGAKSVQVPNLSAMGGLDEEEAVNLRAIAVGARLTYEHLSGDLSKVNWASYRAGLLVYRALVSVIRQQVIGPQLLRKLWDWFIAAAVGAQILPFRASGYPVLWSWPRFESVNRNDDIDADTKEVALGVNTRRRIIAARGDDPDDVFRELAEEAEELRALGITPDAASLAAAIGPRRTGSEWT